LARPSGGACEGRRKRAAGGGPQPEPGVNPRKEGTEFPGNPGWVRRSSPAGESSEFIRGRTSKPGRGGPGPRRADRDPVRKLRSAERGWLQVGVHRFYVGHVLDALKLLPDESVHCVVTSPPY